MTKKIICFVGALALLLLFLGCQMRTTYDQNAAQPGVRNIQSPTPGIPLYFEYKHLPYLGVELRDLPKTQEHSLEQLAIGELIAGPRGNELQRLIPPHTTATTQAIGSTLFVTLSSAFLETLPGESRSWSGNESERKKVLGRRRSAVYSIVNTVTEIGNFSGVQILIADAKSPEGYRPSEYDMGLCEVNDAKVMDVLVRNSALILMPDVLTQQVLRSLQEKQWETVYKNTSQTGSRNLTPVTMHEFEANAKKAELTLEHFKVVPGSLTFTGNTAAIVLVDYSLRGADSHVSSYANVPFRLILVGNLWKAEFDSVQNIIEKGSPL